MADTNEPNWERQAIERLAREALDEQRRARRWRMIRFFVVVGLFLLVFLVQVVGMVASKPTSGSYTALIELDGVISSETPASADNVVAGLRSAFENKGTLGIILRANSPGGSPVQSRYIYDEIKRLREKHPDKPLYAVVGDLCASGCYYIVAAADKIYANPSSLIGSIGVIMNGFGFTETLKKLGVERRLFTAGEHKGFLDPFSPVRPEERRHIQELLGRIHNQFVQAVREGRGKALKETKDTFSGLIWTGDQAKEMGLVDEFGSASFVAREVIKAEDIVDFTFRENVFDRFARRFGSGMGESLSLRLLNSNIR
jgi:protease IV